jgi:hypothetical protein
MPNREALDATFRACMAMSGLGASGLCFGIGMGLDYRGSGIAESGGVLCHHQLLPLAGLEPRQLAIVAQRVARDRPDIHSHPHVHQRYRRGVVNLQNQSTGGILT